MPASFRYSFGICVRLFMTLPALALAICSVLSAQNTPPKPAAKHEETAAAKPISDSPAQLELLETRIRFESNGDSRKEVHARVHINSELGARQFGRLNFDFNRSFQTVEIPFVRIAHAAGGTADILPSAVTDNPNPAVVNYPAYHDVRVKSVRILGLAPSDNLEYRVITTTAHHPLAPDFWLEHSFDRTGVVSQEIFDLDLPAPRGEAIRINPATPATSIDKADEARVVYRWQRSFTSKPDSSSGDSAKKTEDDPDVILSTFGMWDSLSVSLAERLLPGAVPQVRAKALALTKPARTNTEKLEAIYDFLAQKIATVGLPLGSTGFKPRPATEILSSGYATAEDKFVLFAALSTALELRAVPALTGYCDAKAEPRPSVFNHLLISSGDSEKHFWVDPSLEVAPFGMISPVPKKCAFLLNRGSFALSSVGHPWQPLTAQPPFAAVQHVSVDATLGPDGTLTAKLRYTMRGENELLLRMAFHQSPREQWNDVAQLLSLSDGFRGKIASVRASDPYATKEPFTVEYEITQAKFVDWSKKPVRIPAILPLLGLPDPPAQSAASGNSSVIELGTPLEVETQTTLHLPADTSTEVPPGTSVERDYAAFSSRYDVRNGVITASRHIVFRARQLPSSRAGDYNAFVRAVQSDQAQLFTLTRANTPPPTKSKPTSPPKQSKP